MPHEMNARIGLIFGILTLIFACSSTTTSQGSESCTAPAACGTGLTMQACTAQDPSGRCEQIVYRTSDGKSYPCNGCNDCTQAATALSQSCAGAPIGSSGGTSGGTSSGSSGAIPDAGPSNCQQGSSCLGGGSIQICTVDGPGGACASITYKVGAQTFACASCSDCKQAADQATVACSGNDGGGTETCQKGATCPNNGVTLSFCYTTAGGSCVGARYTTSKGSSYPCVSCNDCKDASAAAAAECN